MAYMFHQASQAEHWLKKINSTPLGEVGSQIMDGTVEHARTVFIGIDRRATAAAKK